MTPTCSKIEEKGPNSGFTTKKNRGDHKTTTEVHKEQERLQKKQAQARATTETPARTTTEKQVQRQTQKRTQRQGEKPLKKTTASHITTTHILETTTASEKQAQIKTTIETPLTHQEKNALPVPS